MTLRRPPFWPALTPAWMPGVAAVAVVLALAGMAVAGGAQQAMLAPMNGDVATVRQSLVEARRQAAQAAARADRLEAAASGAGEAADRTARESAAVAARIQQAQAEIAGHEARALLIGRQREALRARLAQQQQPVVRLTAALQRLSRRPMALALLRPGSVREAMYMRALLGTMLPEVERRTHALRAEIERVHVLELAAGKTAQDMAATRATLVERRRVLAGLETRQRLAARDASGVADREAERALALAEQARDLSGLVDDLGRAGLLRERLAELPGPLMRPRRPAEAQAAAPASDPSPGAAIADRIAGYMLPVDGTLVSGFGAEATGAPRTRGIAIAARGGAQAVAPAAGRVVFAGPWQGYGLIVIVEHSGGWTSLVTGLALLDAKVGQQVAGGGPLGLAGPGNPIVTLELRRQGAPVNPLDQIGPQDRN